MKSKRDERAKAITKMHYTKHIEVKAFEFFIIAISSGYYDKMKHLIMQDNFVAVDIKKAERMLKEYYEGYSD